ncbi:MAG: hypothetical protein N3B18_02775, partial [Desulfobacterota bacterium]|nr:hypothetical protein [Thermodesulfobacteriota bacterium]
MRQMLTFTLLLWSILLSTHELLARELKVVIFNFDTHAGEDVRYLSSGVAALLPSRIAVPGSIGVIDSFVVNQQFPSGGVRSVSDKIAMAKRLGADYALIGSITKIGSVISIDAQLLDVRSGAPRLPLAIQCDNANAVIPEVTSFAHKVPDSITQEVRPQLEDVEMSTPKSEMASVSSVSRGMQEETEIAGEDLSDMPEAKPAQRRRHRLQKQVKPAPLLPQPFFSAAPAMTYDIPGKPLHVLAAGDVNGDG